MAVLTDSELTATRADFDALLPGTCNILESTRTKTATGGGTITWGTATVGVKCDVWRYGIRPAEMGLERFGTGAELIASAYYTFALPHSTTILEQNRIEYGGEQFQVVGVDDTLPDQIQLRVFARRTEALS